MIARLIAASTDLCKLGFGMKRQIFSPAFRPENGNPLCRRERQNVNVRRFGGAVNMVWPEPSPAGI